MLRKIMVTAAMLAAFGHAYAAVDVNTANEAALRGIKGIGPAKAKAILEERDAHGPYKDRRISASASRAWAGIPSSACRRRVSLSVRLALLLAHRLRRRRRARPRLLRPLPRHAAGAQKSGAAVVVKK